MRRFRDLPIKDKLRLIIMLTSTVALLLAGAAFATYELITFRHGMTRELSVLAGMIGRNTRAALAFDDPKFADKLLTGLSGEEQIVSAGIFDRDGNLFARYLRSDVGDDWPLPKPGGERERLEYGFHGSC